MTSAELKTLREHLGLSAQWCATRMGVQLRTWQYWEFGKSGRTGPPDDASNMINGIYRSFLNAAIETADLIAKKQPSVVALVRYRDDEALWKYRPDMEPLPCTAHAALLQMIIDRLSGKAGTTIRMIYFDEESYLDWLKFESRDHSEAAVSAWAALSIT